MLEIAGQDHALELLAAEDREAITLIVPGDLLPVLLVLN